MCDDDVHGKYDHDQLDEFDKLVKRKLVHYGKMMKNVTYMITCLEVI